MVACGNDRPDAPLRSWYVWWRSRRLVMSYCELTHWTRSHTEQQTTHKMFIRPQRCVFYSSMLIFWLLASLLKATITPGVAGGKYSIWVISFGKDGFVIIWLSFKIVRIVFSLSCNIKVDDVVFMVDFRVPRGSIGFFVESLGCILTSMVWSGMCPSVIHVVAPYCQVAKYLDTVHTTCPQEHFWLWLTRLASAIRNSVVLVLTLVFHHLHFEYSLIF